MDGFNFVQAIFTGEVYKLGKLGLTWAFTLAPATKWHRNSAYAKVQLGEYGTILETIAPKGWRPNWHLFNGNQKTFLIYQ